MDTLLAGSFFVDDGALYRLWSVDDVVFARGMNTGTTYRSTEHRVETKGKMRHLGSRVGQAQRAILHLDTGEGIVALPGIWKEEA